MKRFKFALVLIAIIGLVFSGCTDKVQSPTAASDNTLHSLSKTTGPGAWIIKSDVNAAVAAYDPQTHLLLIIGINDIPSFLAGTGGVDVSNLSDILLPNSDPTVKRELQRIYNDSAAALVWRTDTPDPYYLLNNVTPTASGYVNFSYNDNDYNASYQDNQNYNAFGWKGIGTLTESDGTLYNLNSSIEIVWDGVATLIRQTVSIQLIPTGQ